MIKNILLQYHQLPPFERIRLEQIEPALDKILADNRKKLQALLKQNKSFSWKNLMLPLEEMDDRLRRMWSPIEHLSYVKDSKKLREIYNNCLVKLVQFNTEYYQNKKLYQAIKSISSGKTFKNFDSEKQKVIKDKLRDFKLSGVTLTLEKKKHFMELGEQLELLSARFGENILDATDEWSFLILEEAKLSGVPNDIKTSMRKRAKEKKLKGFLVTLDFPTYQAMMTYADDAKLREILYEAYVTRASDQGPNAGIHDNTEIMEKILNIRHELAQMLGFKTYADYSLAKKMAKNPQDVLDFLNDLLKRIKPQACQEFQRLQNFAKKMFGVKKLQTWDVAYYSEKLKQKLFNISKRQLRPFFPEKKVLSGLFSLTEKLYHIKIKEKKGVENWHKTVRFFEIYDRNNKKIGAFYTDLYAREHKHSGAWVDDCRLRWKRSDNQIQIPVVYLVCNFTMPTGKKPSLLAHREVETLFHEFGHCLHHLLAQVEHSDLSGSRGVEWDGVELPSQFMENFCWQKSVIDMISSHYKTGKSLPQGKLNNLLESKNLQSAMQLLRQLEMSLFDFRLHLEFDPQQASQIQRLIDEIRKEMSIIPVPKFNRFQHGFCHIFGGGYAAGYYGYLWAEVLSSDAFSLFEEKGIFDEKTSQSFLENILAVGASRPMMKSFINFRGRKPKIDAMLRHNGF